MASNELGANPAQTAFLMLDNNRAGDEIRTLRVGKSTVSETKTCTILGITIEDTQLWKEQLYVS